MGTLSLYIAPYMHLMFPKSACYGISIEGSADSHGTYITSQVLPWSLGMFAQQIAFEAEERVLKTHLVTFAASNFQTQMVFANAWVITEKTIPLLSK